MSIINTRKRRWLMRFGDIKLFFNKLCRKLRELIK